jgi:hypothetical protein
MNRDLFLDGFTDRIAQRFGLSRDFAFEILAIAAILDMTFDEVMDQVSTLSNGNGSHDGGMDGIFIDEDAGVIHLFQVKSGGNLGDNALAKFIADYRNLFVHDNSTGLPLNDKLIFYADELICYALYKMDSDDLASGYETILTALHQISDTEKSYWPPKNSPIPI